MGAGDSFSEIPEASSWLAKAEALSNCPVSNLNIVL
jgi:hypothetical protein